MHRIHFAYMGLVGYRLHMEDTHAMTTFGPSLLPYKLNHSHLHQLVHGFDLIKVIEEILDSCRLGDVTERDKCVALACRVGFLRPNQLYSGK